LQPSGSLPNEVTWRPYRRTTTHTSWCLLSDKVSPCSPTGTRCSVVATPRVLPPASGVCLPDKVEGRQTMRVNVDRSPLVAWGSR
jgi:hypothetical protein